jgi:flagellar motor switch protein FliG
MERNLQRLIKTLSRYDKRSLSSLFLDEHPQTVAVILSILSENDKLKAAETLQSLPEQLRAEVCIRWLNISYVCDDILGLINETMVKDLEDVEKANDGVFVPEDRFRTLALTLGHLDKNTETHIAASIEEKDPYAAESLRKERLRFEDVKQLDRNAFGVLLKEIPDNVLMLALRNQAEEIRNLFLSAMPSRMRENFEEEMESQSPSRISDIETAQWQVMNVIRRLECEGKIIISRPGSPLDYA